MKMKRTEGGFTLMEMLIVIGLLGALVALILPRLTVQKTWAVDEAMSPAEMMEIRRAYAAFQADCIPTAADRDQNLVVNLRFSRCAVALEPAFQAGFRRFDLADLGLGHDRFIAFADAVGQHLDDVAVCARNDAVAKFNNSPMNGRKSKEARK